MLTEASRAPVTMGSMETGLIATAALRWLAALRQSHVPLVGNLYARNATRDISVLSTPMEEILANRVVSWGTVLQRTGATVSWTTRAHLAMLDLPIPQADVKANAPRYSIAIPR